MKERKIGEQVILLFKVAGKKGKQKEGGNRTNKDETETEKKILCAGGKV